MNSEEISKLKQEPKWMLDFRVNAYNKFTELIDPNFGPTLDIDFDSITYFKRVSDSVKNDWNDIPEDIKNTFDALGIPEAEKKSLAGVGAQYDSEVVYHSMKEELIQQGVIYTDMETAVREDIGNIDLKDEDMFRINEKIKDLEKQIANIIEG